jgi:phosphomannomutase/phosphoglucomutase
MFPKPKSVLVPNTYAFESEPMVKATGFREYDARWLFNKEINLMGIQALGMGLGALIAELGVKQEVVTGHDFRGYSASIKYALISGLMAAGCKVHDIGLCMTPMAYFAQFDLDVPCVAMVTASHNDNGWTGVKMGANRPLTFGPDEMTRLKEIVLNADFNNKAGGSYQFHENFPARYIADLTRRPKLKRKLKVVVACGNGTAGAFAPQVMEAIGLRGRAARHRARLHLSEIQSEPRRHGDAARDPRRGARAQGRCRPGLRRRRRPLRRGR